jgi:putative lipoprotein
MTLRGFAVFGHEVRSFRPCGSDESLWAIDTSGVLWSLHQELAPHVQPYEEVFAVVRGRRDVAPTEGFGEDYAGAITVDDVLYVASEGFGCEADWDAFQFRLFGNEPFWSVVISADSIELFRLEETDLIWTPVRWEQRVRSLRFTAEGVNVPGVAVTIEHLPCRDSMSGAYFAFSAALRVGQQELRGCALEGNASPEEWY